MLSIVGIFGCAKVLVFFLGMMKFAGIFLDMPKFVGIFLGFEVRAAAKPSSRKSQSTPLGFNFYCNGAMVVSFLKRC